MKRTIATIIFAAVCATVAMTRVAISDSGDTELIIRTVRGEPSELFNPKRAEGWGGVGKGAGWRAAAEAAVRYRVPVEVVAYHVKRESGGNPHARNPKSTAKGVLQVLHGSHAAIIGKNISRNEHFQMLSDPNHGAAVGVAHIAACYNRNPTWTPHQLWVRGHVGGLRNCGSSLDEAHQLYARNG